MIDHAVTPAAASSTCAAPNSPGTASANAAATGTSAVTASAVPNPGTGPGATRAASTVSDGDTGKGEQPGRHARCRRGGRWRAPWPAAISAITASAGAR